MKARALEQCAVPLQCLRAAIPLFLCIVLAGCIGATPLPKRTRTAQGTEIKNVDMTFIHPGQTTRAEVEEKLKVIDTGYQGDRFFLGRWSSSTWGGWVVLAGMCCEAVGGGGRVWKSGNLLVEFDEAGIVKRAEPFDDKKAYPLLASVAERTPLQLDSPIQFQVKYWLNSTRQYLANVELTKGDLRLEEVSGRKKPLKFSIPSGELVKIDRPLALAGNDPAVVGWRIHCAHDLRVFGGPRGKDVNLQLTLPQAITMMSYVSESANTSGYDANAEKK